MNNEFIIPPQVDFVVKRLESRGYHAYCVGGCVRDHLMGRTPGDYDVTTSARPDEMLDVFADCRLVETGLQHGTVTIVKDGMNIEVTTYRIDGSYDDGRHPDWVTFTDKLSDDLCRRDFTINAMAYSPERGIVDLYEGRDDLGKGVIRCVGRAEERFSEDGLRIMRALRFASVLDFEPDRECSDAVFALTHLLDKISRERIYVELTKLLCGVGAARILSQYASVIAHVLPGVTESDVKQAAEAIERDEETYMKRGYGRNTAMRYALIFASLSDGDAKNAMGSLKPSRAEKNDVLTYRLECPDEDEYSVKKLMSTNDDETPALLARFACILGRISEEKAGNIEKTAADVINRDLVRRLSMLVMTGKDLLRRGYRGKAVGDTLSEILDLVMLDRLENTESAVSAYLDAKESGENG